MLKIPQDKVGHFLIGAGISLVVGGLVDPDTGLIAATVAGVAKEVVWDKLLARGTPEFMDALATAAGGVLGYLLHFYLL
ncbi:MAG: hypothetical protein QM296_11365 [Bacillota bacterium]|jgi:hypothetical protein|nr:hypothetical protein [Bacillota bacterium]